MSKPQTAVIIVLAFLAGALLNGQNKPVSEGSRPYTPSRLDWLRQVAQTEMGRPLEIDRDFTIGFANEDSQNTIVIYVRYGPKVVREEMNVEIDGSRNYLVALAKHYGWSSWLQIKEDIKPLDKDGKK
jgi:hypothetical protein